MTRRRRLSEEIVDKITGLLQRMVGYEEQPEMDSSIETRQGKDHGMSMNQGSWGWYEEQMKVEKNRRAKYRDYDLMDAEDPVLISALDLYADNATKSETDAETIVEVISDDEKIVEVINEVKKRLDVDEAVWSIAREVAKYGDCFEEVVAYPDGEIHRLKHLKPDEMSITVDEYGRMDPETPYKQVDPSSEEEIAAFAEWQVLHFCVKRSRNSLYGVNGSVLYPVRKIFKQLAMMEDAMVIARLTRAQQRYGFLIDVNGIDAGDDTIEYLKEVKDMMKKHRTIDPQTGKFDLNFNPLSMEEDLFIGVREGSRADVKVLQGSTNLGQLADVEYFQNKIFAGLKVPKAYLGFERDINAKATLTEQDVQFARSVRRIQTALQSELKRLFDLVLATRGMYPEPGAYYVRLPAISTVDELRHWQTEHLKAQIAAVLRKEVGVSTRWILQNMLDMTDEDIDELLSDYEEADSVDNRILSAVQAAQMAMAPPEAVEQIEDRELKILKYQLSEEIQTLREFVDWKLESQRGFGIELEV